MTRPELSAEILEAWLQCERRAWLASHRPELRAGESGLEQYLREQRADLKRAYRRQLARSAGPAAIAPSGADSRGAVGALRGGARAIVGCTVVADGTGPASGFGLRARLDALRRLRDGWEIVAIAAGTRARTHHVRRLAFGRIVAGSTGLLVRRCTVAHPDRSAVAGGPLFHVRDVSAATLEESRRLPVRLEGAVASLRSVREPRTSIGPHCHRPRVCPFLEHCWKRHAGHSIFNVPELERGTRRALRSAGWLDVRDVPRQAPGLEPEERTALDGARAGRARIDFVALRAALAELSLPIAYLDIEFATPAVPWIPGTAPFQPLPFQFSVHLEDAGGTVRHVGFLHQQADRDPRPDVADALADAIAGAGSVVVYDAASETMLLEALSAAAPDAAATLRGATERSWDLLAVVRSAVRHPGFGGALGLKRVASTLAPGSYEGVSLVDGLAAQAAWRQLLRAPNADVSASLRRYCDADSRALLRIVRVLRHWAEAGKQRR